MTIDMTAATIAVGTSARDIADFVVLHAMKVATALALVGGVALGIGVVRRKLGMGATIEMLDNNFADPQRLWRKRRWYTPKHWFLRKR